MKELQHRTKFKVSFDILKSAKYPINKTSLMHKANVNFRTLTRYMRELHERGLLSVEVIEMKVKLSAKGPRRLLTDNPKTKKRIMCKTTEKGLKFIKAYEKAMKLYGEDYV